MLLLVLTKQIEIESDFEELCAKVTVDCHFLRIGQQQQQHKNNHIFSLYKANSIFYVR